MWKDEHVTARLDVGVYN